MELGALIERFMNAREAYQYCRNAFGLSAPITYEAKETYYTIKKKLDNIKITETPQS